VENLPVVYTAVDGDGRVSEAEKRRSPVHDVCKTKETISLDERLDIVT
jgi:hypothetical protein